METRQCQIIKKVLAFLPFYLFTFLPLNAQTTFTQRIQQSAQGEGRITIHHDPSIDEIVNGPAVTTTPKQNDKPATKPTPTKSNPTKPSPVKQSAPIHQNDTIISHEELPDTIADMMPKQTYKTTGYRVQAFAGGNTRKDRPRAEQTGNTLRQLFPGEEVYVHFYSPRWICRLGNYRTYEEAHEKMLEVRKMGYESATVVKGKITVSH